MPSSITTSSKSYANYALCRWYYFIKQNVPIFSMLIRTDACQCVKQITEVNKFDVNKNEQYTTYNSTGLSRPIHHWMHRSALSSENSFTQQCNCVYRQRQRVLALFFKLHVPFVFSDGCAQSFSNHQTVQVFGIQASTYNFVIISRIKKL